jgi:hypothetical protein
MLNVDIGKTIPRIYYLLTFGYAFITIDFIATIGDPVGASGIVQRRRVRPSEANRVGDAAVKSMSLSIRMFERFAQANSSDERQKSGTGLGLSIVRQIVIKLYGEAGFDAAPGRGTIFSIELSRCEPQSIEDLDASDGTQVSYPNNVRAAAASRGPIQQVEFEPSKEAA